MTKPKSPAKLSHREILHGKQYPGIRGKIVDWSDHALMPDTLWKNPTVLAAMAPVAGVALGAGKLRLTGRVPNGQRFIANPLMTWTVPSAKATIDGRNLGAVAPLQEQPKLGDFWIPRTGLFALGRAFFDAFDPEIHSAATSRTESAAPESSTKFVAA